MFLSVLFSGCIFSPIKGKGGGPPPPPIYKPPTSPEWVLGNLATAYQHRDPAAYDTLFDLNYTGMTIDQSNPDSVKSYNFTKADEVEQDGVGDLGHEGGLPPGVDGGRALAAREEERCHRGPPTRPRS